MLLSAYLLTCVLTRKFFTYIQKINLRKNSMLTIFIYIEYFKNWRCVTVIMNLEVIEKWAGVFNFFYFT